MDLPITLAVQQVAAKTRITTRRNILTSDLLPSVWPRSWVQLDTVVECSLTYLHVSQHNDKVSQLWSRDLQYDNIFIFGILSQSSIFLYLITWMNELHTCSHFATWLFTAWILIKVKVEVSQKGDGMSGIQVYFEISQKWFGGFFSSTCLMLFNPRNFVRNLFR